GDQGSAPGREPDRGGERHQALRQGRDVRLCAADRRHAGDDRQRQSARRAAGGRDAGQGSARQRRTAAAGRQRFEASRTAMSVSSPFIHRPIATSLLGIAVMLGGLLGYWWLPVSSLPQVDFPTIQVTTQLPGANPDTIVALVTAPLERQFGQ